MPESGSDIALLPLWTPAPPHGLFRVHLRGFSEPELGILVQLLSHTTY